MNKGEKIYLCALLACGEKRGDKIIITQETSKEAIIKIKILKMVAELKGEANDK